MSRSKVRLLLWRWHRRIGLFAALFVLLLAISGIFLNHTSELGLDRSPLRWRPLLALYGVTEPDVISYRLNGDWISHLGGSYLYLNTRELAYCAGDFRGALTHNALWVAACGNELVVFTPQGEVLERLGAHYGLPQPVDRIGLCDRDLCLQSGGRVYIVDIDQLTWLAQDRNAVWVRPGALPEVLRRPLVDAYLGRDITWERVLLDMHSGRLLGRWGPLFMDLIALLFVVLAGTGFYMWLAGQRRRRGSR